MYNLLKQTTSKLVDSSGIFLRLVLIALFISLPLTVYYNLDRGLDLTDTGHYYNTITYYNFIESISSQYFLFWKLLSIPQGVYSYRLTVFFLFLLSGLVLSYSLLQILNLFNGRKLNKIVVVLVSTSSVFIFYHVWMPDPSYNSLGLVQLYFLVGLIFLIIHRVTIMASSQVTFLLCFVAGLFLAALGVSRPPSALFFLLLTTVLYLLLIKNPFSLLSLRLLTVGFLGGLLFLALTHFLVEPLSHTLAREMAGLDMRALRGKSLAKQYEFDKIFIKFVKGAAEYSNYIFWHILAISGAVIPTFQLKKLESLKEILSSLTYVGILGMTLVFSMKIYMNGFASTVETAIYLLILSITFVIIAMCDYFSNSRNYKGNWGLIFITLYLFLLPYVFSLGTDVSLLPHSLFAGGFTVLANLLLVIKSSESRGRVFSLVSYLSISMIVISACFSSINNPFRLITSLQNQTEKVNLRNGDGGTLFVDKPTADFLGAFANVYDKLSEEGSRPYLVDLSGRFPLLSYHIDAKPLTVPWVNSSEKKAQVFFEHLLTRLSSSDLRKAWVIDMPTYKDRLDPKALSIATGLDFPQDYKLILVTRSPRTQKAVFFYRPVL